MSTHPPRRSARLALPLVTAGVLAGGFSLASGLTASAASVTAFPVEAWTGVDTPLAFTGVDPVNGLSRSLGIDFGGDDTTCVVNTPATNDYSGDCAGAHFYVPMGTGTVTVDVSQVAYVGAGVSGEYTFTITGPIADVQAALATATYVPAPGFTTDGAGPIPFTVEGYDAGGGGLSTEFVDIYVTDAPPVTDAWFTHAPDHVYTPRGTQLDFTAAPDPVTGLPRNIAIDPPFDSSGCTFDVMNGDTTGTCLVAVVEIAPTGTDDRGSLFVGVDTSGFAFTPLAFGGAFSMGGTEEQVQTVLSSLSYLPPDDTFVTPDDDPVPVHVSLYESDGYLAPFEPGDSIAHDEYIYVHVIDIPEPCVEEPTTTTEPPVETTEPPVETTEPPVETTEPPVETTDPPVETTEPPVETTDPQRETTTTLFDTTTTTGPSLVQIPDLSIPIPTFPVPVVTPPVLQAPVLQGPVGFAQRGAVAAAPQQVCPPDTTTPGGTTPGGSTVPGGSLPATGASSTVILAFGAVLTASGIALLALRDRSSRS